MRKGGWKGKENEERNVKRREKKGKQRIQEERRHRMKEGFSVEGKQK